MSSPEETWRVYQQEDGRWRWVWEGTEGAPLFSAHTFDSPEEAEESARASYPNLLGTIEGRSAAARVAGGRGRRILLVAAGGLAAVLGWRRRHSSGSRTTPLR
jgi:hypothetical protein